MIIGAHSILYSTDAEADREFLRDVLGLPNVDVGEGWLIFGLPPAEVAVHPSRENDVHEFYLMCDDVAEFIASLAARGHACSPIQSMGWGLLTQITLPGGGKLGVYQPRHARPPSMSIGATAKRTPTRGAVAARGARKVARSKAKPKSKSRTASARKTPKRRPRGPRG